ncbi:rhomboid family intramembrane serine protease [bacterium]|nr:rhomboid family intramembrane serine protease [bacterium]
MRRVGAFTEADLASSFVRFLKKEHISALIEEDEGAFVVWVHDESHVKRARALFEKLQGEDFAPLKNMKEETPPSLPKEETEKKTPPKPLAFTPILTNVLLLVCVFVYIMVVFQEYQQKTTYPGVLSLPKVGEKLLIDYPESFVITKELMERYGVENVRKNTLPAEAAPLVQEFNSLVPWIGIYHIFLSKTEDRDVLWRAPLLTNVREGEVWRLFTPAILHRELLHFLFNMLWLIVLGRVVELNTGVFKFGVLVLLSAIASNLAQYFVSGPVFMGFSGVVAACIGYVWVRKKRAPWEVYGLQDRMMTFLLIYIFGLTALQGVFFLLQFFSIASIPFPIANTAHVVGFLTGAFFAMTGLLAKKV